MRQEDIGRAVARLASTSFGDEIRSAPPGVTIAVPNWNHEYVLPRSVKSALEAVRELAAQDIPAEVLVIDDQSRDGSLTLLRQLEALYYEDGLRAFALADNQGLPSVRNAAIHNATYRYVLFMDADNELFPQNVHLFYRTISETEAALVYGPQCFLRDGQVVDFYGYEALRPKIYRTNYIDAFAIVDRQQIADVQGYANNMNIYAREDWELVMHLTAMGRKVVFLPVMIGLYYVLGGSMIQDAETEKALASKYMNRVYDQFGYRDGQPLNAKHLRYHPDIGYF